MPPAPHHQHSSKEHLTSPPQKTQGFVLLSWRAAASDQHEVPSFAQEQQQGEQKTCWQRALAACFCYACWVRVQGAAAALQHLWVHPKTIRPWRLDCWQPRFGWHTLLPAPLLAPLPCDDAASPIARTETRAAQTRAAVVDQGSFDQTRVSVPTTPSAMRIMKPPCQQESSWTCCRRGCGLQCGAQARGSHRSQGLTSELEGSCDHLSSRMRSNDSNAATVQLRASSAHARETVVRTVRNSRQPRPTSMASGSLRITSVRRQLASLLTGGAVGGLGAHLWYGAQPEAAPAALAPAPTVRRPPLPAACSSHNLRGRACGRHRRPGTPRLQAADQVWEVLALAAAQGVRSVCATVAVMLVKKGIQLASAAVAAGRGQAVEAPADGGPAAVEGGAQGEGQPCADASMCAVCREQPSAVRFAACGHTQLCLDCAAQMDRLVCPVCSPQGAVVPAAAP